MNEASIKYGFIDEHLVKDEFNSSASEFQDFNPALLSSLLVPRKIQHTILKLPSRHLLSESTRNQWLKDLANPSFNLKNLVKSIPHGFKGSKLLEAVVNLNVPFPRAIWFMKAVLLDEFSRSRDTSDYILNWTVVVTTFLSKLLNECISGEKQSRMDFIQKWIYTFVQINYRIQLARWQYLENMLDQRHFLKFTLDQFKTAHNDHLPFLKNTLLAYMSEYSRSRALSKYLLETLLSKFEKLKVKDNSLVLLLEKIVSLSPDSLVSVKIHNSYSNLLSEIFNKGEKSLKLILENTNQRISRLLAKRTSTQGFSLPVSFSTSTSIQNLFESLDAFYNEKNTKEMVFLFSAWAIEEQGFPYRRFLVGNLFIKWIEKHGNNLQDDLVEFLDSCFPNVSFNLLILFDEFIQLGIFSLRRFMTRVLARGYFDNDKRDFYLGIVNDLPVYVDDGEINLKRIILNRPRQTIDEYHSFLSSCKEMIKGYLPSFFNIVAETCSDFQEFRNLVPTMRYYSRTKLSEWLKSLLLELFSSDPQPKIDHGLKITVEEYISFIDIFEILQDLKSLIEVSILLISKTTDRELTSVALTILFKHLNVAHAMNRSLKLFKVLYTRNISDSENGDIHLGVVRHAIMIYDNCGLTLDEHRRQLGEDWEKYTKNVSDIKVSLNYSKLPASLVYYSRSLKACTEIYRNCAKICFSDMGSFDQMDLMVDKLADLNTYNHYLGDIIFNDMNGLKITENSLYSSIYDTNNIQVAGWLIRLVAKDCISSSRMLNIIYDTLNYNNQSLGLVLSLFNLADCIITRDSRSIDLYKLNKKHLLALSSIQEAYLLTEELLPVCFKIFELSRKFSIDSNYSNINSIGSLLNPKSSFHTLVKSLFALQPVRLLNLLESSISKPHSDYLKQIYLEETASSELLNTDEALEKIVHLNSHSWKFLLVKLEAFLDHSKTEPFALFETMLLAFSRGEISMSTLLVVLENIDSRFGLDYRIFSWTEYIIKHIENPTSIEGWIQNVFSDATKFNAFCEFISTLLLSFITRNEINGNYNRICFDFIEQIIIIRIRLLDSYNNTIDPESIKRNLLFNISLLIPFANFIQSHPAESKVIEVSKILLRSLSCKLLHSKDQEWHFNLIFDLLCWISDDIKKEFKNGFFAMLRESRSVLDFPEFCSDRISRILPFQVSSRYNDIEKGNDLKPYTWLEEWDESINSDHAASLPLSLFGAAVIPKKERTYQSLIKTGWRNSL